MTNMYTKFEVAMFIDYDDMKGNVKYSLENKVVWELRVTKVTGNVTIR